MQAANDLATPLFNVYRVLQTLNSHKTLVLDQVPRFLEAPFSFMPRNYLSNAEVCQVQFHRSTTYPWGMLLIGANEAKYFPPFTPVVPLPTEYGEGTYDRTTVTTNRLNQPVIQEPKLEERKPAIPVATDYNEQIMPDQLRQTQRLQIPMDLQPKVGGVHAVQPQRAASLCKPGARIVYQFANTPGEFYETNKNSEPTPYAPAQDVIRQYERYLMSTAGVEPPPEEPPKEEPKPERMDVDFDVNVDVNPPPTFPTTFPNFQDEFER